MLLVSDSVFHISFLLHNHLNTASVCSLAAGAQYPQNLSYFSIQVCKKSHLYHFFGNTFHNANSVAMSKSFS